MTTKDKMDAFWTGVGALADQLGIQRVVMQVQLTDEVGVSSWWPGCSSDCNHVDLCAAHSFGSAAKVLSQKAHQILDGEAVVIDGRKSSVKH